MKRAIIGFLFLSILAGCAATNLPPVTSPGFTFEQDEERLWRRVKEEQDELDGSGQLFRDKGLEAYLNKVAGKLQSPKAFKVIPFDVKVLKSPYANAFALPNGGIYVSTGLLARIDNEAQLASVLAHEMTHATHRHGFREYRGAKNKAGVLASVRSTIGALPGLADLTNVLGSISARASIAGYSRKLETEADMVGLKHYLKAGYHPNEAAKVFEHLQAQLEEEGAEEPFFFGSHPKLQDRIDNYRQYLSTNPVRKKGEVNAKVYNKKVADASVENIALNLKEGRFESALKGAKKYLAIWPRSARGNYLAGEIHRQRGEDGDMKEAVKYFRKSVSLDSSYPDAHKGLGLAYLKTGKKSKAKKAFSTYLKLQPKAPDKEYIKQYIAQCK